MYFFPFPRLTSGSSSSPWARSPWSSSPSAALTRWRPPARQTRRRSRWVPHSQFATKKLFFKKSLYFCASIVSLECWSRYNRVPEILFDVGQKKPVVHLTEYQFQAKISLKTHNIVFKSQALNSLTKKWVKINSPQTPPASESPSSSSLL